MDEKKIILILNRYDSERSETDLSDEIIRIQKFPFQSKVMIKKLLKIAANATMLKKHIVLKLLKILISKFESIN